MPGDFDGVVIVTAAVPAPLWPVTAACRGSACRETGGDERARAWAFPLERAPGQPAGARHGTARQPVHQGAGARRRRHCRRRPGGRNHLRGHRSPLRPRRRRAPPRPQAGPGASGPVRAVDQGRRRLVRPLEAGEMAGPEGSWPPRRPSAYGTSPATGCGGRWRRAWSGSAWTGSTWPWSTTPTTTSARPPSRRAGRAPRPGVVRAIGAGMNQAEMLTRFVRELDLDLVLMAGRYSLLDQGALAELLPACVERGVAVVIGGVFNSGLLADPRPGQPSTTPRPRRSWSSGPAVSRRSAPGTGCRCGRPPWPSRSATRRWPACSSAPARPPRCRTPWPWWAGRSPRSSGPSWSPKACCPATSPSLPRDAPGRRPPPPLGPSPPGLPVDGRAPGAVPAPLRAGGPGRGRRAARDRPDGCRADGRQRRGDQGVPGRGRDRRTRRGRGRLGRPDCRRRRRRRRRAAGRTGRRGPGRDPSPGPRRARPGMAAPARCWPGWPRSPRPG